MLRSTYTPVILSLLLLGAGCGGDAPPNESVSEDTDGVPDTREDAAGAVGQVEIKGSVQKGPFVVGSSITVAPLDPATLQPTGQTFATQTSNDRGEFEVSFEASGPVAVEGTGFYYDEVTGELSTAQLTLRAFYIPTGGGPQGVYLNLVTHLTTGRTKTLVAGGTAFGDAIAQAERELFEALALTREGFEPTVSGVRLNVLGGDNDDNAYLLLMGATLLQTAAARPGDSIDAKLQELLNQMANDLADDGTLAEGLRAEVAAGLLAVDIDFIETHLAARFAQIGSTEPVPRMARVADQDGDGLANDADNCPLTVNADQANGDGDSAGDACDVCPETACEGECTPGVDGVPDACLSRCESDADCAEGVCIAIQYTPSPGNSQLFRMCGVACDPLASSCADGDTCAWASIVGDVFQWSCIPTAFIGDRAAGQPCAEPPAAVGFCDTPDGCPPVATDCAPGLICAMGPEVDSSLSDGYRICRSVCDPAASGSACGDEACVATDDGFGQCELGPGRDGDSCSIFESTCGPGLACNEGAGCMSADGGYAWPCCRPAGGIDQQCYDDGGCDDGLICGHVEHDTLCGEMSCCLTAGGLDEPCFDDDSCNGDLTCVHDTCVPEGSTGDPCENGVCGEGLRCIDDHCVFAGDLDQRCYEDGTCRPGLACVDDTCVQTGGPDQPCSTEGTCNPTLRCIDGICTVPGGLDQPCTTEGHCDAGLACVDDLCVAAGGLDQPCHADGSCDPGLTCRDCSADLCCQP